MVAAERIQVLNDADIGAGKYVLYWMQSAQRADANPALEYAIEQADELDCPCVVSFGLMEHYPEGQARHYAFMLQGLTGTAEQLAERGITLIVRKGNPWRVAAGLARAARLVVCDVGYLRTQQRGRRELAAALDVRVIAVEANTVVPIAVASDKAEYAARTLRPKITRALDGFLRELRPARPAKRAPALRDAANLNLADTKLLDHLDIPRDVPPTQRFTGGTDAARARLTRFLRSGLAGYGAARNDPADPTVSELSPYLHFGQISPVEIALKVRRAKAGSADDKSAYLEELIVRRELAANYVAFTADYDRYASLPEWARKTLAEHRDDPREHVYTRAELEHGETHDPYFNAAMLEARATGYMHNYMRMYWGKKILEWTNTPEYAYATALYLNNKYFLDGRDPSTYANIGWLFGLHDRAWTERPVFGKIRYMNAAGLERKFDISGYVQRVEAMAAA